jgi:SSS family solute:Na+ symporter
MPGVIAYVLSKGALHGNDTKTTFVWLLNYLLPTGLRGLLLASLLAAMISSLLAVMNSISTLAVRDFLMRYRPNTSERGQVYLGRIAILVASALGFGAAYMVYKTPDGLYKYLQTISIYLVMPITPAIAFGIMSKRVTLKGATASVMVGVALATVFVTDQLIGPATGARIFPWLHKTLTLNYTYRGLWGTLAVIATLFLVSAFTEKTSTEKLEKTTMDWGGKIEAFQGLKDWRLQLAILSIITIFAYRLMW